MYLPHLQNKRKRIPKWRATIENLEKLTTKGTQSEDNRKQKHNSICVGHHYVQKNTNNVNKT